MLQPFPESRIGLRRQDFCISPENVSLKETALSCVLSTKQCGSYLASTNDPSLIQRSAEPLLRAAENVEINGWLSDGADLIVDAKGGCQTLLYHDRYRDNLWKAFGYDGVKNSAQGVTDAISSQPVSQPLSVKRHDIILDSYGSPSWMIKRYLEHF